MKTALILLALTLSAQASPATDAYVQQVNNLVAAHRSNVARLTAPATTIAQARIAGGAYYLGNNNDGAFFYEGSGRAGGLMQTGQYLPTSNLHSNDVVFLTYSASTYQNALNTSSQCKCLLIAFGPQPPAGPPAFPVWIDSLTAWAADDEFTLLGNVLSAWSLTGEVAAATARQGKTLVFWQGVIVPGGLTRDSHYTDLTFHDGLPAMAPIEAGKLSGAYLDSIAAMLAKIQKAELDKIIATGQLMAQHAAAGTPVTLVTTSHIIPFVGSLKNNSLFEFLPDNNTLDSSLNRSGFLVDLGYTGVDLELWRAVRLAGAKAIWIIGQLPNQTDFTYFGDTVIGEHWRLGDAVVKVPGYDVRLLPESGIAQLFIYELLLRAAQSPN